MLCCTLCIVKLHDTDHCTDQYTDQHTEQKKVTQKSPSVKIAIGEKNVADFLFTLAHPHPPPLDLCGCVREPNEIEYEPKVPL